MQKLLTVISWAYSPSSRHLKIIYSNGDIELYHPVPEFVYDNLLRRQDKMAFVQRYLEYNLHFDRVCLF
ncbi:KTSC domain-containing protein [Acinetobacter variabilis]|uniref:KTSC domain-containing protein n=1 Tax=Acinetobacter variabilis TaxID=70346 RepID=UPI0028A87A93|nr:KTSC domain-containing protein [Acinetobacter variabilis]